MTAQMPDSFRYRNRDFAVDGISEGKLFDPSLLGLEPAGTCSACWRGYQAIFAIHESHLVLDALDVNLILRSAGKLEDDCIEGPIINGVAPIATGRERSFFNNHYDGLKYKLNYSGGLLLVDGYIEELYRRRGYAPPWRYKSVIELVFDNGILKKEFDRSEKMEEFRYKFVNAEAQKTSGEMPSDDEVRNFVERAFDQRYQSGDSWQKIEAHERNKRDACPSTIASNSKPIADQPETSKLSNTIRPLIISELVRRQRRMWYIRTTIGVLLFGFLAWRYDWGKWAALAYLPFPIYSWWALSRLARGSGK
ncbi:MAG: hypothetical protein RL095_3222 [Verrucomicrobiota bacterium]|jgi:hypothetical protein